MPLVNSPDSQGDLFETQVARRLLDQLLADSKLYTRSKDYKDLLDFVARLRNFAPFNAMLLHLQKPGLRFAASANDWRVRFDRFPREGARPLLIMWPFGPVALVYDQMDTDGKPVPEDASAFPAFGEIQDSRLGDFRGFLAKKKIEWNAIDAGDDSAGSIRALRRAVDDKDATSYRMNINRNHTAPVQFATLAHELGHLFLGHLGADAKLNIPRRRTLDHAQRELEAESVAFLVCRRNGVSPKSQTYLSTFVDGNTTVNDLDLYQIMRAAGQVETVLRLGAHSKLSKAIANRE